MKKVKEFIKKKLESKRNRIISIIVLVAIIISVVLLCLYNKEDKLDTRYIIAKLEKSSELTTAKLNYTGISKFKDDGIPIINRSNFLMVYDATVRAGIDVKEIEIDVNDLIHVVWITIPKAKILDVKVESDDIDYYDEGFALFNVNEKEDANRAVVQAEKEAKKDFASMGILEMADAQAEALIKGLIQDVIPEEYEIKIKNK